MDTTWPAKIRATEFQSALRRAATGFGFAPSFRLLLALAAHPILDVIIDDEIQFLRRETVMRRKHSVYFVEDWFAGLWINALHCKNIMLKLHYSLFRRVS